LQRERTEKNLLKTYENQKSTFQEDDYDSEGRGRTPLLKRRRKQKIRRASKDGKAILKKKKRDIDKGKR